MKILVPHKLVINFESNGEFREGIYLYKIFEDGKWSGKYNSIPIKDFPFSKPQFNQMLVTVKDSVKSVEKITGEVK